MNPGKPAIFFFLAFAGTAYSQGTPSEYTTYLGDANTCHIARVRTDLSGNTYVAGNRTSGQLSELFVAILDPKGAISAYSVFGGNGTDTASDMALDSSGNLYIAGSTSSTSFPLLNALQATPGPGFVVKLDAHLRSLYATYFPAAVTAVAADTGGNAYVTGTTNSPNFPVTPGLPAGTAGGSVPMYFAAFLTKISPAGDHILYSTRISGTDKNCGCCSSCFLSSRSANGIGVAVDPAGNAYIAGNTDTSNLPATSGALLQNAVGAFVAKVNAAGTELAYLTYVGPTYYVISPFTNPANTATALAVDSTGAVYLSGSTFDPVFPATPGAYQTTYHGPSSFATELPPDAFVLKLKPDGSGVIWATYLGGAGSDRATAVAADNSGNVWIAGTTASADFPNAQGWSQGGDFLAGLNASGTSLTYAARYPSGSVAGSLTVDSSGLLHTAGATGLISAILPSAKPVPRIFGITNAAWGPVGGQMAPGELISIFGPHIGPATPVSSTPSSDGTVPNTLGGVQVMMGFYALPLLYVSDSQINAVAPFSLFGGPSGINLQVVSAGVTTPPFSFASIAADPQIFQNPDGSAVAVNQDGSINSYGHPAEPGSIVAIWITGAGNTSAALQNAQIATAPLAFSCCAVYAGTFGSPAPIAYSGSAPGAVNGVMQINFQVPGNPFPEPGSVSQIPIRVAVGGATSNPVQIYTANEP